METLTKKEEMYCRIKKHGENLNKIFNTGLEPIILCKKLRRLEVKAHSLATDYCNGTNNVNSENWESLTEPILEKVKRILNPDKAGVEVFINGDARGYALKIDFGDTDGRQYEIYRDWGGYGIIAPDLTAQQKGE